MVRNRPTDAIGTWPIHEHAAMRIGEDVVAQVFTMGHCRILVSHDPAPVGWHLSISCADRDPTWQEIATARYRLLPHVPEMVMCLPPLEEYVNLHPFCFHLYEQDRLGKGVSA